MHVLRYAGALSALVAALVIVSPAAAADDPFAALLAPAGTCGAADDRLGLDASTAQLAMQCLTNYAREQSGLPPLRLNSTLNAGGEAKLAADISCGEFSHTPCGRPFETVFADYVRGATQYRIGENIAWGTGSFGTPRGAMDGWLHSTGHRENILSPGYTEVGIGYLSGQTFQSYAGATLWSQEFGTRTPASTDTTLAPSTTPPSGSVDPAPAVPRTTPVAHTRSRAKSSARRLVVARHRGRSAHWIHRR